MKPSHTQVINCTKCSTTFTRRESYKRHYLKFHKEDSEIVFPPRISLSNEARKERRLEQQRLRRQAAKSKDKTQAEIQENEKEEQRLAFIANFALMKDEERTEAIWLKYLESTEGLTN
jgi:uncharacterized C2H2 Zn-finger protein